ncbi:hypothetical protein [Pseudoclavibacter helvolus]|uniref:Uncharacterized protein n=1 Tax=Pseudoclavibacter helvolus TaxID=255205 RepID=A0A7W4UMC4_9MICO|nr:hypothetical protein [Pseudoclavibacter helvolus]MBB2956803.1 hypothetical protein [Pseudoclavibacter helvolus]
MPEQEYTPTETRLRERVKGSLEAYAHEFGIDGEAAMDEWIDQALAERDNRVRADERAKFDAEVAMLRRSAKTLGTHLERSGRAIQEAVNRPDLLNGDGEGDWELVFELLAGLRPHAESAEQALADERAKRPDRDAVPIIDSESWGWGHCIACGGGAVTHRGMVLLSVPDTPTLARIAWCEAEECIEDRKLTVAFPVTPRHVEWIDAVLALEPEAREEAGPALRIDDDGAHIYWADPVEGCWVAFRRVDCVGEEELPERRLPAPEAREVTDVEVEAAARVLFAREEPDMNDWRWSRPNPHTPDAPFEWHNYWLGAARAALEAAREVSRG